MFFSKKCRKCNNLSPYGHSKSSTCIEDDRWLMFEIAKDLGVDSDNDCPSCALIVRVLSHYFGKTWRSELILLCMKPKWPVMLHMPEPISSRTHGKIDCIEIFKDNENRTPFWSKVPGIGGGAIIFNNANDQGVYEFISDCVLECESRHAACPTLKTMGSKLYTLSNAANMPTRLLEISGPEQDCKLVDSDSHGGKYIALSYCWGTRQPLKTTKATLESHRDCIPWASLPRLFKDVVEIAYKLQVRYIWIDSLCIIQDDYIDWEVQSTFMAAIYQNAYITIMAASSSNPEMPILKERNQHTEPAKFEFQERFGAQSFLYSLPITPESTFNIPQIQPKEMTGRPWEETIYSRGWTFQEDLLSKRVIHYLPNRVVWECRTIHRDERQLPRNRKELLRPFQTRIGRCFGLYEIPSINSGLGMWWDFIEAYTSRHLTYLSDKLPAMSGIARLEESRRGGQNCTGYLAGLWRDSLLLDMTWEKSHRSLAAPPKEYLAPTWSWASLGNGEAVSWLGSARQAFSLSTSVIQGSVVETSIIDAKVSCKGSNRFGELTDGYITLRGPLCEIELTYNCDNSPSYWRACPTRSHQEKERVCFTPDTAFCIGKGLLENGEAVPTICRGSSADKIGRYLFPAYVIFLCSTEFEIFALALGRSPRVRGAYERVGIFTCHHTEKIMHGAAQTTITIF